MPFLQLVARMAHESNSSKVTTNSFLRKLAKVIKDEVLIYKGSVVLPGLGKFSIRHTKGGTRNLPIGFGHTDTRTVSVGARDTIKFVSYAKKPTV